jgi:hypothetical protein
MIVGLVRKQDQVVLQRKAAEALDLPRRQDRSGGILRRIDDDAPAPSAQQGTGRVQIRIEPFLFDKGVRDGRAAGEQDTGVKLAIPRVRDQDLRPGFEGRPEAEVHGLLPPCRDHDLGTGVVSNRLVLKQVLRNGLAELRDAGVGGVVDHPPIQRPRRRLFDVGRRVEIRPPDLEVFLPSLSSSAARSNTFRIPA